MTYYLLITRDINEILGYDRLCVTRYVTVDYLGSIHKIIRSDERDVSTVYTPELDDQANVGFGSQSKYFPGVYFSVIYLSDIEALT